MLGYDAPGVVVKDMVEGTIGRDVFLLTRGSQTPAVTAVTRSLQQEAESALALTSTPKGRRRGSS